MKIRVANWSKKILALLIAVFLWFYVDSVTTTEQEYWGKIQYIDIPPHLIPVKFPTRVKYSIKTNRFITKQVDTDLVFEISLKNATVGSNFFYLEPTNGNHTHLKIHNNPIEVVLERKVEKKIPLKANINNYLSSDYTIEYLNISPQEIIVTGPESYLAKITEITTEEVLINKTGIYVLDMKLVNPFPGLLRLSQNSAQVKISVISNVISQELFLSVRFFNLEKNLAIKRYYPERILAKVSGIYEEIKKLDLKNVFCYIDLKEIKEPGIYKLSVEIQKNPGVHILLKEEKIEVEIKKME